MRLLCVVQWRSFVEDDDCHWQPTEVSYRPGATSNEEGRTEEGGQGGRRRVEGSLQLDLVLEALSGRLEPR